MTVPTAIDKGRVIDVTGGQSRVVPDKQNMKRKITVLTLCALLFTLCLPAEAQQATKIPRIGFVAGTHGPSVGAFERGLRDLGYIEGKTILIEYRFTGRKKTKTVAEASSPGIRATQGRCLCVATSASDSRSQKGDQHDPYCTW